MEIFRIEHERKRSGFTMVPNSLIRDPNLPLKATAIMIFLLSHEHGFSMSRRMLDQFKKGEGRTTIDSALQQLEERGYLRRVQERTPNGFGPMRWIIDELGQLELPKQQSMLDLESPAPAPVLVQEPRVETARELTEQILALWNEHIVPAQYKNAQIGADQLGRHHLEITENKISEVRTRMKDPYWLVNWRAALIKLSRMPHAMGKVPNDKYPTGWKADWSFFLRPKTVEGIMEGKYDHWISAGPVVETEYRPKAGSLV